MDLKEIIEDFEISSNLSNGGLVILEDGDVISLNKTYHKDFDAYVSKIIEKKSYRGLSIEEFYVVHLQDGFYLPSSAIPYIKYKDGFVTNKQLDRIQEWITNFILPNGSRLLLASGKNLNDIKEFSINNKVDIMNVIKTIRGE
mgnify:CR=1 FL=1